MSARPPATPAAPAKPAADWAGLGLVVAVALAASAAGIFNAFAYDDIPFLQLSPRLQGLDRLGEILTSPYWPPPWNQEHYRPLTSLLLALEWTVGSGNPVVFRLVSYLLYAATSAGVYLLASRLLPRPAALAAGLLFAAHPVHVEVVAPAVGQSELVVGLLAVIMTLRYLDGRRRGALAASEWALLGLLYFLASLAKEHGLVVPSLLVAVELLLVPGGLAEKWRATWKGYALLAGVAGAVVALRLVLLAGTFSGQWTAEVLEGLSLSGRALTMLTVVPEYLRLLVWPAHLRLDYGPQEMVASAGFGLREATGALLLVALLATAWWGRRRAPALAFGLAWAGLMILPFSNVLIPTGNLMAERFLFLPSAGFVLAVGGLLGAAAGRWLGGPVPGTGAPAAAGPREAGSARPVAVAALAVLVVAGVARSAERHRVWRNEAFLSVRGVQDAPRSFRAQRAYAEVLFDLDQRALAEAAYREALELAPPSHRWRVRNDLARRYRALGETAQEADQLRASLAEQPEQEDTRGYLIVALLALGRYPDAMAQADSALAAGASPTIFSGLRAVADSAARAAAPPGSVRIRLQTGPAGPARP